MTSSWLSKQFFLTIRGKIMLAFLMLATITCGLGLYAIDSVVASGRLVEHTFNHPLAAISQAGLARADFTALELAIAQDAATASPGATNPASPFAASSGDRIDKLDRAVKADLSIAGRQSTTTTSAAAARTAEQAFEDWQAIRDAVPSARQREALREQTGRVRESLGLLGDLTMEDGARDRGNALTLIDRYRTVCVLATMQVLLIGWLVAVMLIRQLVTPIAAASEAAGRIAAGELETEISPGGKDELGQLLSSMMAMRDNIRLTMDREIAARRSAQTQLADAIEGAQSGVALLGADGRVLIANSRIRQFFPSRRTAFAPGERVPVEIDDGLLHPTGETQLADGRWLRLTHSPSKEGGTVLIASDISFLKEREAALREARDEAEAANRAKTDFLTNMSHELRTPLSAVIGFSEMIVKETFGPVGQPQYKEFADDILHAGRHLMDVITDILDIAKAQSGKIELKKRIVRPEAVMRAAIRIMHEKARDANIMLESEIEEPLPPIEADTVRLRQVLLNLLSNALKFTAPGGTIRAVVSRHPAGIVMRIHDSGPGMAPRDIPRALQPFVQVDNSLARRHGGAGLGLPLTRIFVELHGGWLEIESTLNVGTTVSVILPTSDITPEMLPFAASIEASSATAPGGLPEYSDTKRLAASRSGSREPVSEEPRITAASNRRTNTRQVLARPALENRA